MFIPALIFCGAAALFFPRISRFITYAIAFPVYLIWSTTALFIGSWVFGICNFTLQNWFICAIIMLIPNTMLAKYIDEGASSLNL